MDHAWNWFKYSGLRPGYFLFFEDGRTIPTATRSGPSPELTAFLQQLDQAVPPFRVRSATGFGWVQGDPMDAQSLTFQFLETTWDPVAGQPNVRAIASQRFVQELTFHQVGLVVGEAMPIILNTDETGFEITHQRSAPTSASANTPTDRGLLQRDPPPGPSQNIWIHGADQVKIDKVGMTLTLPLFGEDRGALEVPLEELVQNDFQPSSLDSALYYFGPGANPDQFQALRFPVVDLNVNGASATTTSAIDLEANLYGAQPEHSYFDYQVGQSDGGGGRGTAQSPGDRPVLGSFLRTYDGHNIYVAPTTSSRLTGTTKPNNGVWANYTPQNGPLLYFSPHGSFELVMDDPVPAESWILGGFAGTEYISFTPRNGVPGDVVTFYPHQGAYAPKFGSTTPSSGGDLLTLIQRTSWVSVESFPEQSNAPPIQYFAQPDDAPLFGTDTVGSTNPYLVFKAIPANNLPVPADGTGLDSFPLAPFSGITAPDPLVDETADVTLYRTYEQTVLSPQRKERISSVAVTTRASASGRVLEQAGNENTTTPQGILATINGSDFVDITLADNEDLLLKLDQISEQFQDSLQTNRLFLPITKPNVIHWLDNAGVASNFMTIEDWPFEIEVGGLPSGIESAGANFYNVLIFKYYDRSLMDLLEDTSLWSQPDHYNDNPTDLQAWIKSFIADTKTRAQDPELAPLYANFLDIVDNPNWNGIVAFNVSIPLQNLPTEVQGLLSGIKHLDRFVAHHFGINVSKISPDASKIDRSSLFGLIDYVDDELHPTDADYDFRVGLLQVLFANTEIASFDAKIYVMLNLLFDEPSTLTDNSGNPVPGNEVELIGTYEDRDGEPSYSFTFEGDDEYVLDPNSPALAAVSIMDAEFVTISGPDPDDFSGGAPLPIISEFQFAGDLRFVDNEDFDFFSYEAIGFTGLTLGVQSDWIQDSTGDYIPEQPADFTFSAFNVSLDGKSATVRPDSLFANFPLTLADFTVASLTFSLSSLGYIPVPGIVPGVNPVLAPKYSLEYNLSLGTQGVMVSINPGFALKLLVGWTPSTSEKGGVATGFKFPLVSGGGSTLGIQGVLQLSLTDLGFVKMSEIIDGAPTNMYAFFLNSAALHVLGVQIPPGGSFSMALFVPESQSGGIDLSNLGWFVAYSADSASTSAKPPLPPVLPGPPAEITTAKDIQVVAAVAIPTKTGDITKIDVTFTLRNNGSEDADAFDVTVNRVLPFAPPYGPTNMNTTRTYTDLASGDRIRRTVTFDAVADGTHRFEVTALFPGDENATNDGTVTNAVSVAAPSSDDVPVFKLDYLGIGQRVGFPTGTAAFGSVETAITGMGSIIPAGLGSDALVAHLKNIYDPNGGWLIAFDFTLFEVLRLAFIFDERDEMYGVLIGFAKEAPGPLKGFKFQILYKKVSDSVGVYMLDLTLPDIIRQWQFGAVAITLPNIGIDIYTNGDFKVDVGFPAGFDFSRSFNVQFQAGPLPIIGYGGFYFAVLSTATSKTIPQLKANSTAQFNPVLEAGFGLSVGLGKTIEKGIFRAGATITIEGILEGTVAWYIPPDGSTSALVEDGMTRALQASFAALTGPPDYFRIKGQVQIVGRIYGKVDFGIVSAGVSLVAKAGVAITFESYGDLVFLLYAEVTATASITIAFITLDFSFSLKIKFEFTVENFMGDAPWQSELASGTSERLALQAGDGLADTPIAWTNQDLDGAQIPITVYLAPQMVPVGGQANLVASLIITKGGSPSTDFEDLLDDLLLWTVGLADDSDIVDPSALTVAGLQEILNRMSPPATPTTLARQASNPLDFELLQEFLNTNFTFSLASAATLDNATASATVFPMVPGLVLDYGATGTTPSTIDFATHNDRDEDYEDNLAEYFAALLADFEAKTQASALRAMLQAGTHSMAEIVFQDYFAFLIKSGIDQMQQQLEADGAANKPVADLIADTRSGGGFATVAATAARYFLHGLQLPADPAELANFNPNVPSTIPDDIQALYGLTGQQVPVIPATGTGDIWSANLKIGPENVLFPSGTSVTHTFTDADAQAINDVAGKTFGLATITTQLPPTVDDAAREFAFRDYIDVAGGAGNARLYPFSDAFQTLVANEAASGNNVTANVNIGTPNNQPILTPVPASDWSWALQAGLTVQRFPSDKGGEPLTNVYQLGGTDQITRNVIANIIEAGPAISSIRLLYAPEEGGGLVMGPDQGVTLLKINLSTVTAPPRELLQATSTGIFTASISDATNFLTLVWQVSVVNAGGFYLHVDGDGLPDHVFGEGSDPAPITLLVEFSDDSTVSNYANALSITSEVPEGSFPYVNTPDIPAWYPSAAPGTVPFIVSRVVPGADGPVAENLYNLLTYWLAGGNGFNETIHGLPVGPTEDPATANDGQWHFHQTMPIARYYAAGGGSPYAGVGQTTSISFAFLDVFGNPMPIDGGANLPALPVTIRYFDPLIGITQWPSIETSHIFNNDGTLDAKLVFSGSGFVQAAGESTTAFEDRVEAALDKYLKIQGQLSGVGVSAVLETTIAPGISTDATAALDGFVASIIGTLQDQLDSGTPATDLTLDLSLAISTAARNAVAANIQEVEVFVRIARDAQYVDTDASDVIPEVAQVSITISAATQSVIDPESGDPVDSTLAFALYAEQFETAFPEFKLATGPGEEGAHAVWAVRMGDLSAVGQGISYAIDSTKPQFFAPAPLSTNLLTRNNVEIFPEGPGPGKPTSSRNFSNVDLDLWGRQFTTAVDKFLSPASAAKAQATNRPDYDRVVAAKGPLAEGVSLGVVPVLTSTGEMDDDLAAARETFKQRVLVGAANAYEIETVVQYPVATTNTDPDLVPEFAPNLYGKIRSLMPEDTEADPNDSDYSFSSAKIALQNGGGNNTNLTFLFDARRQLNLSNVDASIGYQISHVEHQIEDVPFGGGTSGTTYKSSFWLSLVRPIRDIEVDPGAHVPIALREYPTPPGLKSQTAIQASLNGSTTISNATLWDYTYTYEQQAIAQDTILSNVRFNVGPSVPTRGIAQATKDLFDWLARFSVEYPTLSDNLTNIDIMDAEHITWFAELVEGVANAWGPWVEGTASTRSALQAALEEFQWGYRIDEVADTGAGSVDIIVRRDAPDAALVPPRTEARFPDIQLTLPDGNTVLLENPTVSGDEATYTFDWSGDLPDRRVRSLIIDDLDILNVENGWGGIQLARNLNLSAYAGRSTNPSFIYQTPLVRFVNKVTPLIDVRTPINVPDNVTASGTSLSAYLEAMLDTLFASALEPGAKDRLAKIGVRYGFDNRGLQTVAEGPLQTDEVIVELPVLQRMPFEYRPDDPAALAGPLAQEIQEWFDEVQPLTAGGYYDIDFSVFAALSNTQLPVLRIRRLWIGLDQIS